MSLIYLLLRRAYPDKNWKSRQKPRIPAKIPAKTEVFFSWFRAKNACAFAGIAGI